MRGTAQVRHAQTASVSPGKTNPGCDGRQRVIATVHGALAVQTLLAHRAGSGAAIRARWPALLDSRPARCRF